MLFTTPNAGPLNRVELSAVAFVFAVSSILPNLAGATSCGFVYSTLAEDFVSAAGIVIAQVSGCPGGVYQDNGRCPEERYHLDVLEVLKDSVPSRDFSGTYVGRKFMGCGLTLNPDQQYLLFVTDQGAINHYASGALKGEIPLTWTIQENVRILRQYKKKEIHDLSGPWRFADTGVSCELSHQIGKQSLMFNFAYVESATPMDLQQRWDENGNALYDPIPSRRSNELEMRFEYAGPEMESGRVFFSAYFYKRKETTENKATISVGQEQWSLHTAKSTILIKGMDPIVSLSEVASGVVAMEILDAMLIPRNVVARAEYAEYFATTPPTEQDRNAVIQTRTTQIGVAAKRFLACVDGSAREGTYGMR